MIQKMKISNISYSGMKPMEIRLSTVNVHNWNKLSLDNLHLIHTCIYYLCIRVRDKKVPNYPSNKCKYIIKCTN